MSFIYKIIDTLKISWLTLLAFAKNLLGIYNNPRRYDFLFDVIRKNRSLNIMEIGVWNGTRAKQMIETALKNSPEVNYFGFDLFEELDSEKFSKEFSKQPPTMDFIMTMLKDTGAHINLFKGDTTDVLPKTVPTLPMMDLIFIDGGHSYETIMNDWDYSKKLMHPGTVVVFDDYWVNRKDGAGAVIQTIDRNLYDIEVLPTTDVFFNPNFGRLVIRFVKVTKK